MGRVPSVGMAFRWRGGGVKNTLHKRVGVEGGGVGSKARRESSGVELSGVSIVARVCSF